MQILKRGTIREDGKVFWRYNAKSKNGECWTSPSSFEKLKLSKKTWVKSNPDKVRSQWQKSIQKNKEQRKARSRKAYKENPERFKNTNLKSKYGITLKEYNELLFKQNGVCEICSQKCKTGFSLSVDHCHRTGKVRGLLCVECNTGIGKLKDSPKLLFKAISYLVKKSS
jgi:hypothetical protein